MGITETVNRQRVPVARQGDRSLLPPHWGYLMAKTYNNLLPLIYDFANLELAYKKARSGKRDRREVQQFELDLEGNLIGLQNSLIWGTYRTGEYRRFTITEPVKRSIAALPFRDRVLQHAIVNIIEPIWECRFIDDSYACRPGRGTHKGADRAQAMLRTVKRNHGRLYVFKADIAKYFYSIDHQILKRLIRRRIACKGTLALLDEIIDSTIVDGKAVGLPIGNLTSQLFANVYMHELDEFAKHALRERYYVRYMDDFIIVHHDKKHLRDLRVQVEAFLWDNLRLRTNAKTQIFPVGLISGRGLDFLGYRIWPTHRKLRISSIKRIKTSLRRLARRYAAGLIGLADIHPTVRSWVAHASHANTHGLRRALLSAFTFITNKGA